MVGYTVNAVDEEKVEHYHNGKFKNIEVEYSSDKGEFFQMFGHF